MCKGGDLSRAQDSRCLNLEIKARYAKSYYKPVEASLNLKQFRYFVFPCFSDSKEHLDQN